MAMLPFTVHLQGCSPAPAPPPPPEALLRVEMREREGGSCDPWVNGRAVNPEELLQIARGWRGRAILVAKANAPYRCIGGALYSLQRGGIQGIGFSPEPPAPEEASVSNEAGLLEGR